ncbi:Gfo/Idh/MocA family protein [Candidatus Neomarinimicrobiota bacterium]
MHEIDSKSDKNSMSREKFVKMTAAGTAAATAFTIVPRNVLGGPGYQAPSDKIVMAHIGCGTQGHNELGPLLNSPDLQFVAVCDPETDGRHYVDFGSASAVPSRVINNIRGMLDEPDWRAGIDYIPGGRLVMKEVIETFYAKQRASTSLNGVNAYADFRELLDSEDIDAVKIMTPDHLHATIAVAAMNRGKHVIVHKPLANRMTESNLVIETARRMGVATYFMPYNSYDDISLVKSWINDDAIGTLREIHNWTNRPVWPQYQELPTDTPPVPAGFDWDLWLGPCTDRPYHPNYTHCVFRGWYDFGGGSLADMGHYSLWTIVDGFDLDVPAFAEAYGSHACKIVNGNASTGIVNDYSFPLAATMRFHYEARGSRGPLDLFWYDGGMRPSSIPELDEGDRALPASGMLYVGDKGKILNNRIIPESRMQAYSGQQPAEPQPRAPRQTGARTYNIGSLPPDFDQWIAACRGGTKDTPGNFISAESLSTMVNLGYTALRAGRKLYYDPVNVAITNYPEANRLLTREYRTGWQL